MIEDHNSGRWLAVVYRYTRACNAEGWLVIRTCPCHDGQRVTVHFRTEREAWSAVAVMLAVAS